MFYVSIASGQVSINDGGFDPHPSAGLDVNFSDLGLLIPRVSLNNTTDTLPIAAYPATGLLVYNTATGNDVTPGFYYWNGTRWVRFATIANGASDAWTITGNAGTTAGTNFLGTTDNQALDIRTNNTIRMRITSAGNVGIGTTSPNDKLEVDGFTRTDGIRTAVLTTGAEMVYIRGTGLNHNANRVVKIGKNTLVDGTGRGLNLCIITAATHQLVSSTTYDTYGDATASDNLATALNNLTRDQIGILTSCDAWEGQITNNLRSAARRLGLFKLGSYSAGGARRPYAAIFYGSGTATGNTEPGRQAIEVMESDDADAPYALISTWLTEDAIGGAGLPNALVSAESNTVEPAVLVNSSGNVGIGTTSPSSKLSVGASSQFQVNSSGNIVRINNVPYNWPTANGAGTLLNDGSGNLSWQGSSWEKKADVTLNNVTSYTVTGLDGDADVGYTIVLMGQQTTSYGSNPDMCYVQPNGDATANNYSYGMDTWWAYDGGYGWDYEAYDIPGILIWVADENADPNYCESETIISSFTGNYRHSVTRYSLGLSGKNIVVNLSAGVWRNSTSNITSLVFNWTNPFTGRLIVYSMH